MLVRGAARAREFALRTALGARRARLVRQLLTESAVIAAIAGDAGIAIALIGVPAIVAMAPASLPSLNEIRIDALTLGFTIVLALGTALAFGVMPALRASRIKPSAAIAEGGRGGSSGPARRRIREALVIGEIAVAVVLLVGAGLLLTSFVRLVRTDPGFVPERVVAMTVSVSRSEFPEPLRRIAFFRELEERIAAYPGVTGVGAASRLPLDADPLTTRVHVEGEPVPSEAQLPEAQLRTASSGYFRTMGIPVLRGRSFSVADDADSGAVLAAVVTQAFARELLQDGEPLGRRIQLGGVGDDQPWFTIIGVVGDLRDGMYREAPQPQVFRHALQAPATVLHFVIRSSVETETLVSAVRSFAGEMAGAAPVHDVRTMNGVVARAQTSERFLTTLVLAFAALGLVLAGIGIYGVLASAVTERTPEIGIRLALGAQPRTVIGAVIGRGMLLAAIGLVAGSALAIALTRALANVLYGVAATDPRAYLVAVLVLGLATALATAIPAIRASRVDPLRALRSD
jgi:putative ABC transport system permease protein